MIATARVQRLVKEGVWIVVGHLRRWWGCWTSSISSRLVINQAALKPKRELIQPVADAFSATVGSRVVG